MPDTHLVHKCLQQTAMVCEVLLDSASDCYISFTPELHQYDARSFGRIDIKVNYNEKMSRIWSVLYLPIVPGHPQVQWRRMGFTYLRDDVMAWESITALLVLCEIFRVWFNVSPEHESVMITKENNRWLIYGYHAHLLPWIMKSSVSLHHITNNEWLAVRSGITTCLCLALLSGLRSLIRG